MKKAPLDFDTVRAIGRTLPGVEESTAYGSPALKVNGRMFACIAINKSAEPNTLVVVVDFERRDELIAAEPDVYYLKDHYVNYPSVLVRLGRIHLDALRDLLHMAHRRATAQRAKRRSRLPRRSRPA